VADTMTGMIDAHDSNANRVSASTSELVRLIVEIVTYSVYLLYHGLCENFHLNSDFHGSYLPSPYRIARIKDRRLARNNLTKRAIPAPRLHPSPNILGVHDPVSNTNCREEFRGPAEGNQIFVKVHCNEIALICYPVAVDLSFKEALKFGQ